MDTGNPSGINPMEYNVLVKPKTVENRTSGGLYIPDEAVDQQQWAETRATVVAVSADAFNAFGDRATPGDEVIFAKNAGRMVKGVDGVEYKLVKDKDIVAKVGGHV
ncbi:MAG: putative chaperonin 10 Kd subunit [Prokaryotic dsDNA virus sp.]|nr:MAG: putative chaperonin 10 Kd subunit [Prokaryotic dsDNA virus sp.]